MIHLKNIAGGTLAILAFSVLCGFVTIFVGVTSVTWALNTLGYHRENTPDWVIHLAVIHAVSFGPFLSIGVISLIAYISDQRKAARERMPTVQMDLPFEARDG
jgi:hypothetical protein